ncbi:Uncharacterised protein [uncultured archaeon]|nr:Uncharacterised protein [uncultured archaeon]
MPREFEVTTIIGEHQKYEVIEVEPVTFASGNQGSSCRTIFSPENKLWKGVLDNFAFHAYQVYEMTGLDSAIKAYPPRLLTEHDGERFTHAEIESKDRLRLIYDVFPSSCAMPILRISPSEGQLYISEYDPKSAKLPLEKMSFSQEFEGSLDLRFASLQVFLHLRPFEEENCDYYSRDLKKSF